MNVLYLGQYRGPINDGWSEASRKYLESLLLTKHNISCKPIYMGGSGGEITQRMEEAENNVLDKVDVIIQHCLPDLLEYHEGYNIGLFFTETSNIQNTGWIEKINLMDEVWVSSPAEKDSLIKSGVVCKISVVPIPYKEPKSSEPLNVTELDDKFVFYFIGEHTHRKNIMALVKAFHREFSPDEDVGLLLKTNECNIVEEINKWKEYSRLRKEYIPEIIVNGQIPEGAINGIHAKCDAFVVTSYGECFCMPILDAMYHNNAVLCTKDIFATSLFKDKIIEVDSRLEPVDTQHPPLPHIYTYHELWHSIDILDLQNKMRQVYKSAKPDTKQWVKDNFSYKTISETIECLLSAI